MDNPPKIKKYRGMTAREHTKETIPHPLYQVELCFEDPLDGKTAEALSTEVEDLAVSVFLKNEEATDGDRWTIVMTTMGKPDIEVIGERLSAHGLLKKKIKVEKLPEKNWLQHVYDHFPPVTIGDFFVYGAHYTGDVPVGKIPLQIDAATAFGTGEHETTKGCLLALQLLKEKHVFKNGLDMGCGSGILAIAMKKLWPDISLSAVDIDPESVTVTKRHAAMNDLRDLAAAAGDGYQTPLVSQNAPYDIVTANILAGPLVEMAPDLKRVLKPGGFAILSGLLARQEKDVAAAHAAVNLRLVHREEIADWRALVFQKG